MKHLQAGINEAITALYQEFFKGAGSITFPVDTSIDEEKYKEIDRIQKTIFKAIDDKDKDTFSAALEDMFVLIEKEYIKDIHFIYRIYFEIIEVLYIKVRLGSEPVNGKDILKLLNGIRFFNDLKVWVKGEVSTLFSQFNNVASSYSNAISEALQYIELHYSEPLTLSDVASYVFLHPNYFCRLFKKETGENFSVYLLMFRLKKAEQLLKNSKLKVYEIAEMVGYPNLSYFSRIYKKYIGENALDSRN